MWFGICEGKAAFTVQVKMEGSVRNDLREERHDDMNWM